MGVAGQAVATQSLSRLCREDSCYRGHKEIRSDDTGDLNAKRNVAGKDKKKRKDLITSFRTLNGGVEQTLEIFHRGLVATQLISSVLAVDTNTCAVVLPHFAHGGIHLAGQNFQQSGFAYTIVADNGDARERLGAKRKQRDKKRESKERGKAT